MKDIKGNTIPHGSVIRWYCWDSDDFVEWEMTGLLIDRTQLNSPFNSDTKHVVYLGGGVDFGFAIGKHLSVEEVTEESSDSENPGIYVIGKALDLVKHIKRFGGQQ